MYLVKANGGFTTKQFIEEKGEKTMKLTKFLTKLNEDAKEALSSKDPGIAIICHLKMNALVDIFEPEELFSLLGDDKKLFLETTLLILTLPMDRVENWLDESEEL